MHIYIYIYIYIRVAYHKSVWWIAPVCVSKNKYKLETSNKTNMWYICFRPHGQFSSCHFLISLFKV